MRLELSFTASMAYLVYIEYNVIACSIPFLKNTILVTIEHSKDIPCTENTVDVQKVHQGRPSLAKAVSTFVFHLATKTHNMQFIIDKNFIQKVDFFF